MNKKISKATLATLSLLPASAFAATSYTAPTVDIKDPNPKATTISGIIEAVLGWAIPLVGAVAVLFIIYAGIQYITAGGSKDRVESAKKTLTYAVIGLVVVVLAGAIVALVKNLPSDVGLTK